MEDPQKKAEVANTTLSRLIAGDFLESLGKELGMEVPPELPRSENKVMNSVMQKEILDSNKGHDNILQDENKFSFTTNQEVPHGKPYHVKITEEGDSHNPVGIDSRARKIRETGSSERNAKSPSRQQERSFSSLGDERSRKRSQHHWCRRKDSESDTSDSSDRYRDRDRSRSKGRKKESSQDKSSSRKHSKHHKHRSGSSPSRSSRYGSEKKRGEAKREKRKWKD